MFLYFTTSGSLSVPWDRFDAPVLCEGQRICENFIQLLLIRVRPIIPPFLHVSTQTRLFFISPGWPLGWAVVCLQLSRGPGFCLLPVLVPDKVFRLIHFFRPWSTFSGASPETFTFLPRARDFPHDRYCVFSLYLDPLGDCITPLSRLTAPPPSAIRFRPAWFLLPFCLVGLLFFSCQLCRKTPPWRCVSFDLLYFVIRIFLTAFGCFF